MIRDVSLDSSPYAISNDLYIISTEYYPSEPERAAKARRAVVASLYYIVKCQLNMIELVTRPD